MGWNFLLFLLVHTDCFRFLNRFLMDEDGGFGLTRLVENRNWFNTLNLFENWTLHFLSRNWLLRFLFGNWFLRLLLLCGFFHLNLSRTDLLNHLNKLFKGFSKVLN